MLGSSDLDRLADDIDKDRRITGTVYCGRCGYNLKTLPYVYQCPECGGEYNARPLVMKGIFLPYHVKAPWVDCAAVLFCAYVVFLVVRASLPTLDAGEIGWMSPAVILGLVYLNTAFRGWGVWFRTRWIARRVARDADESESAQG